MSRCTSYASGGWLYSLTVSMFVAGALAGCNKEEQRSHFPVSGRVSFEGETVSGGTVTFHRSDTSSGGEIDSSGHFSVVPPGLMPGVYQVSINPPPPYSTPPTFGIDGPPRIAKRFPEFPQPYRSPLTSGFRVTIGESQNFFDFTMVKQPEIDEVTAVSPPESSTLEEVHIDARQSDSAKREAPNSETSVKPTDGRPVECGN